jgi:hypothetical protein
MLSAEVAPDRVAPGRVAPDKEVLAMVVYTYNTRIEGATMKKKLTITVSEDVYDGLYKVIGHRRIGEFLESLARPHVVAEGFDEVYAAMAADEERERQALQWAEDTADDL